MPLGARGFLVSCINGREAQATREALSVLQEVRLYLTLLFLLAWW